MTRRGAGAGTALAGVFLCATLAAPAGSAEQLFVLAVDGGAHEIVLRFLREGRLPNFARVRDEGALADGMVTAFPSKTAPSFAMLWTGYPGRKNGITGNSVLALPPESHSLLDTVSGFSSEILREDPLWIRVARAGGRAVALHTTHTWPLDAALARLDPPDRERVAILTGFGDLRLNPAVLSEERNPLLPPEEVPGGLEAAFRFQVAGSSYLGVFLEDPMLAGEGWDTFGVLPDPAPEPPVFLARAAVGPGGGFSVPVGAQADVAGGRVEFQVRAFAADPGDASSPARFLVYRSGASEVGLHPADGWSAGDWTARLGSPSWPRTLGLPDYVSGRLGPTRLDGGDGTAEERLLEISALVRDITLDQLAAAAQIPDQDLIALYMGIADEAGHLLVGYLDEALRSHDPELASHLWPVLARVFEDVDRVLGRMLNMAWDSGGHVLVVSDHGMAGTDRRVHLNEALERAGLLAFGEDGLPDLSRTRAMLLTTADGSVAVNRSARPGGIVPPAEEAEVLDQAREALLAIRGPDGARIVTGFVTESADGPVQPGGDSTGDLFPILAPGWVASALPGAAVVEPALPAGNHGYLPTRRDMLGVLGAWGPRIAPGSRWPRASALDVVPTALDLLGMPTDPDLPGRSLLGSQPIVPPTVPATDAEGDPGGARARGPGTSPGARR